MNMATSVPRAGKPEGCYRGRPLLPVDEALAHMLEAVRPVAETETLPVTQALGRVLAREAVAGIDVPGYDNSGVDGFAVRSTDTRDVGSDLPIRQRIAAGGVGDTLEAGTAARIFTGAPIPPGADAVAMQEDCEVVDDRVRIAIPLSPGENIRPRGQNVSAGSCLLEAGHRLRPQDLGLAASVGISHLRVHRPVRVSVFSTGDELRLPGEPLGPGEHYTANNAMLSTLLQTLGCEVRDLGIIADDLETTCRALREGAEEADLVISSGGVSVGEEDHVRAALAATGELELWRIAMRPGKPLAFGRVGEAWFLGLPGNAVSTLATFLLFARPLLLRLAGATELDPPSLWVQAGFDWPRAKPRREFARARIEHLDGVSVARLHPNQSSDVLSSAVWADGLVEIPEGSTLTERSPVRYLPFSTLLG